MNELDNRTLNLFVSEEVVEETQLVTAKTQYRHHADGFKAYRKSKEYKDLRKLSKSYQARLVKSRVKTPKRQYAKRGSGKDNHGKRKYSLESKTIRKWAQKTRRLALKANAVEAELQLKYITNASNLPASWISESREIQIQFAREHMKMDETFIENTPHDIFSGFYAVWKVCNNLFYKSNKSF